jgi:hypothetical protein
LTSPQKLGSGGWRTYLTSVGDINGDLKSDLVFSSSAIENQSSIYIALSKGDGTFNLLPQQTLNVKGDLFLGDVNGDRRSDLLFIVRDQSVHVAISNSNGTVTLKQMQSLTLGTSTFLPHLGDANNDGKTDLMFSSVYLPGVGVNISENIEGGDGISNNIAIVLSNGDGSFSPRPTQTLGASGWTNYSTRVGDVNGDGKTDFIFHESVIVSSPANRFKNTVYVALSGSDGRYALEPSQTFNAGCGCLSKYFPYIGDFSGDGRIDLVVTERLPDSSNELVNVVVGLSPPPSNRPILLPLIAK